MSKRKVVRLVFRLLVVLSFIAGLIPTGMSSLVGASATKIYFTTLSQSIELLPSGDYHYSYPVLLGYNGYLLDLNIVLIVEVRKGSPYGELASSQSYGYDAAFFIKPGNVTILNVSLSVPRAEVEAAAHGSPLWIIITTIAWFTTWFMGEVQIITPTVIRTVIPIHLLLAK